MSLHDKRTGRRDPPWVALFTGILSLLFWPITVLLADEPAGGNANPPFSIDLSVERVGHASINGIGTSLAFTEYSAGLNWQFLFSRAENKLTDYDIKDSGSFLFDGWIQIRGFLLFVKAWNFRTHVEYDLNFFGE
ncbi:MAG: hypothetical protein ACUBOA_02975 [Candidatus Loosdrechtia sp.]|uniref:hypothetical protein n=1 Tax=Candidatus Loosdrechtia sp. TaxID=3101272 RepID=UPI003A62B259|nr:MAG: hypothetical protein QY305_13270 [Candidatus Jettenia sp. AMX2]